MDAAKFKVNRLFLMKNFLSRKSILIDIIVSYILIGTILITLLSTLFYKKFSDNSIQEIKNVSINSLNQTRNAFDILWNTTYLNMFNEFKTNSTLIEGMNVVDSNPIQWGEISKTLNDIVNNNNIFVSMYVYNSYSNVVFSSTGTMMSSDNFYDPGIIKYLKTNRGKIFDNTIIYRKMKNRYDLGYKTRNVMSVIFTNDALKSAVIYNIDQDIIQKLVTKQKDDESTNLLVFNRDGNLISDSRYGNIYTNISNESFVKKIKAISGEYGAFEDIVDGNKSLVTFDKWDSSTSNLGWTFVSISDYKTLLLRLKALQKSIILMAVFFILLSILIAGFFAENIYRPFFKLVKKIKAVNGEEQLFKINEYDYLKNVYDFMAEDIDNLKTYKNNTSVAVRRELLDKILEGKVLLQNELDSFGEILKFSLSNEYYTVVNFRLDNIKELEEKRSQEEINLLRVIVGTIADEQFGEYFEVETITDSTDCIVIVNAAGDTKSQEKLREYCKRVQELCKQHHDVSVSLGIGSAEKNLKGIHFSYMNAREAINYRLVYGKNAIIDYADILTASKSIYEYPYELEKGLMDALKAADERKVEFYLNDFVQSVRKYSYDEIILAINQLTLVSIRSVKSLLNSIDIDEMGICVDYRLISKTFKGFEVIDEIQAWLLVFYTEVMNALKKKYGNKYEDIMMTIKNYIDENYSDQNISIEVVSDLVNLSTNYVRTLFKEYTGISISNYINEKRFAKARELLIYTNHPACKIAEMVGFPAGSYFYTAFKKASGMSPDEYRKSNV